MSLRPRSLSVEEPPTQKKGGFTLRLETGGISHESLEELDQLLNVAVEDATLELERLFVVLEGKIKGITPCPHLTKLNGLMIAERLKGVVERIGDLRKIIDQLTEQAGDDPRYFGPGIHQNE